ncbi:membrane protein [Altererythrobacter sp. B11]|uniref:HupE/UreJ family protein n=1 Tax=Altererythrobacter sp. B11 TaxID=2060312 RepID=UPI000DC716E9|nr:HupE/UreJ family protein [Altererythrobacter sp. B11]BBC73893.1 membrane protein [Altererythrobacter sp. B11]
MPNSPAGRRTALAAAALMLLLLPMAQVLAHDLSDANRAYVQSIRGAAPVPFLYLGAKHMVTGIDHILFLVGVVFYLQRMRDVVIYVSMFTLGHSLTLLGGVLLGVGLNASLVDAVIGLSVVYKAIENLGGFARAGVAIDTRLAVFVFGLFHGMGLATKLMDLSLSQDGLLANLLSFNLGVELGQIIVLAAVLLLLTLWRGTRGFAAGARVANWLLLAAGIALTLYHLSGYFSA